MGIVWKWNNQYFDTKELLYPDPFDPRFIKQDEQFFIALSDRWSLDVLVDPEDYNTFGGVKWTQTYGSGERIMGFGNVGKDKIYARRTITERGKRRTLFLHRLICEAANGPAPSIYHVADHLNSDTLDCRRHNLRWATLSENAQNKFGVAWLQGRLFKEEDYGKVESTSN